MKRLLAMILFSAMMFEIAPLSNFSRSSLHNAFSVIAEAKDSTGSMQLGDVDGDGEVSSGDARLILRASVRLEKFADAQRALADVDFDKSITSADARLVLRASVGLESLSSSTHVHSLSFVQRVEATVSSAGNVAHYHCSVCGKNYKDKQGKQEIKDVIIPQIAQSQPLTAKQIYNQAVKYTVEINVKGRGFSGTGTGVVYSSDGKIVTNYHVIEGATSITVRDINNNTYSCTNIIGLDEKLDIAIIQVNAKGLTAAPFCDQFDTGDIIYTLGSSEGLSFTIAEGLISNKKRELISYNPGVYYIQISAPISHGNSGGPLIDVFGRVIGINSLFLTEGQNLNFAIPVSYIGNIKYNSISLTDFYSSNTVSKQEVFYSFVNLAKNYGTCQQTYSATEYILSSDVATSDKSFMRYALSYVERKNSISPNFIKISVYYSRNGSEYSTFSNMQIALDFPITGQFGFMDSKQNHCESYYLINPDTFTENQRVSFLITNVPKEYNTSSGIQFAEEFAGMLASGGLSYLEFNLNKYGLKYSLSDLGFVNF